MMGDVEFGGPPSSKMNVVTTDEEHVDRVVKAALAYGIGGGPSDHPSVGIDDSKVGTKANVATTSSMKKRTTCRCDDCLKYTEKIVEHFQTLTEIVKKYTSKRDVVPSNRL